MADTFPARQYLLGGPSLIWSTMKKQSQESVYHRILSNWSNPPILSQQTWTNHDFVYREPYDMHISSIQSHNHVKSFFPSFLGELLIFFSNSLDVQSVLPDQACARFSWIAFVRRPAIFSCGSKIGCAMFIHAWTYPKGPIGSIDLLYAWLTMHQLWQEWKQLPNGSLLDATSICSILRRRRM